MVGDNMNEQNWINHIYAKECELERVEMCLTELEYKEYLNGVVKEMIEDSIVSTHIKLNKMRRS